MVFSVWLSSWGYVLSELVIVGEVGFKGKVELRDEVCGEVCGKFASVVGVEIIGDGLWGRAIALGVCL